MFLRWIVFDLYRHYNEFVFLSTPSDLIALDPKIKTDGRRHFLARVTAVHPLPHFSPPPHSKKKYNSPSMDCSSRIILIKINNILGFLKVYIYKFTLTLYCPWEFQGKDQDMLHASVTTRGITVIKP